MISLFSLSVALYNHLRANTAMDIARDGEPFTPSPNGEYLMEKVVPTETVERVGQGPQIRRGFYQVIICTPISKGNLYNNSIADTIQPIYLKGTASGIEHNGQKVAISSISSGNMYSDSTHLKTPLTIAYTVIA